MKKAHKLLILISILTVMLVATLNAQEVKPSSSQPFVFKTEQLAIGSATKSTFYKVIKEEKHFFYKTKSGSYYYVIPTKTGEYRRVYEASLKGK